jgi:ATP-dependent Lon protease
MSSTPVNLANKESANRSFVKQITDTTETNSDRKKEILELEQKLACVKNLEKNEEKYLEIIDIWSQAIAISSPLSHLFSLVKLEIEELFQTIQEKSNHFLSGFNELLETKQSLKILKKRFQKLAFENLEVNNLIKEKENSLFRAKEKIKVMREKMRKEGDEKDFVVNQMKNELVSYVNETRELQKKNFRLQVQVKNLKKIVGAVRNAEELSGEVKERILSVLNISEKNTTNLSISNDFDEQSLILASTTSKYNSFMSSCDIEI